MSYLGSELVAHRRRRSPTGGFRGRPPMGAGALTTTPQQRILTNYYTLQSARLRLIQQHMKPLPPNATPRQREQALQQLFNLVRVGGTLGMQYHSGTGRTPRGPDDALRTRQADCDELCMLFIAGARHLNIPLTGVSMGVVQFNTSRPGTTATEGHAMLFIRGSGGNQVFDFTHAAPRRVASFSQTVIQNLYRGNRLTTGPGTAGYPVTSIASMQTLTTASDMAAVQLLHMADRHVTLATGARTSAAKLQQYDAARGFVQQAITLGSRNRFVTGMVAQAALSVFDGYHSLGNAAYTAAGSARGRLRSARYTRALSYYTRALQFYRATPSLARSRATEMHDIHESRGLIYQQRGSHSDALREFDQMIRLQPTGWSGYTKRISLLITMAKSAASSRRTRSRVRSHILAAERTCRTALARIPNTSAMATHRAAIQNSLTGLQTLMRRRGWTALP